jgi:hypothetical protein
MDAKDLHLNDLKILLKEKWNRGYINEKKLDEGVTVEDLGNTVLFKGKVLDTGKKQKGMIYEISATLKDKMTVLYNIKFFDVFKLTSSIDRAVNTVEDIEMTPLGSSLGSSGLGSNGGKSKKRKRRSKRSRRRSRRK